jgi:hypothetical protein
MHILGNRFTSGARVMLPKKKNTIFAPIHLRLSPPLPRVNQSSRSSWHC